MKLCSLLLCVLLGLGSPAAATSNAYEDFFLRSSRAGRQRLCGAKLVSTLKGLCQDCYCVGGPGVKVNLGKRSRGQSTLLWRLLSQTGRDTEELAAPEDGSRGRGQELPQPAREASGRAGPAGDRLERELAGLGRRKRQRVSIRVCCTQGCTYSQLKSICGRKTDTACQCGEE